jgi:hypothetical protein
MAVPMAKAKPARLRSMYRLHRPTRSSEPSFPAKSREAARNASAANLKVKLL